jgi:hypothetical protein
MGNTLILLLRWVLHVFFCLNGYYTYSSISMGNTRILLFRWLIRVFFCFDD